MTERIELGEGRQRERSGGEAERREIRRLRSGGGRDEGEGGDEGGGDKGGGQVSGIDRALPLTTCTSSFRGSIDHMWHSEGIGVLGVLSLPYTGV